MNYKHLPLFIRLERVFLKFAIGIIVISIIMIAGCSRNNELISYDFNTYLSCNTDFEKKASMVLPSKKQMEDFKVVYYALYDNSGNSFQEGMMHLTVECSKEQLINETQRLEELYKKKNIGMGGKFYYNGVLYDSFQYRAFNSDIGYCALAYHICLHSNTISYIVLSCENLTYMSVGDAISFFPQIDDQIVQ